MKKALAALGLGLFFSILVLGSCTSLASDGARALPSSVRSFLDANGPDLAAYEESDVHELGVYFRFDRRYVARAGLERAWALYNTIDPRRAWKTDMTRLGVVYDPKDDRLYSSACADLPRFAVGQTYVLELTVAGFLRLPAAFRISRIDASEHVIEFVYLEKNVSKGLQRIGFSDARDRQGRARTVIDHESWFRSGHDFRDHFLYAIFHEAIIDAFHWSVLKEGRISAAPIATPNPFTVPAHY